MSPIVRTCDILLPYPRAGCRFHVDCHLDRPLEVEAFLNMVSVAALHKLGYAYQGGRVIK